MSAVSSPYLHGRSSREPCHSEIVRNEDPVTARPPGLVAPRRGERPKLLVVDDNDLFRRMLERMLADRYEITTAPDGAVAIELLMTRSYDVVLCDVQIPRLSGVELLRVLRTYSIDVPVVLMTGEPSTEASVAAIELGALTCIAKPINRRMLDAALSRAGKIVEQRTASGAMLAPLAVAEADSEEAFERALDQLFVVYQPIVDRKLRKTTAYEALMRTREPAFPNPGVLLRAAEKLGRLPDLGRRVRATAAKGFEAAPPGSTLFVNLHPDDLRDPALFAESCPLRAMAPRVVLEITERAALDATDDIRLHVRELRRIGYRIAVDDLGAGYAGLSTVATLEPDIVKLDMSLVRGIDASPIRIQLVQAMTGLCRDLDMRIVAEAIETREELGCIAKLGCDYLQGFLLGRPALEPAPSSFTW